MKRLFAGFLLVSAASITFGFTNSFTLDFNAAGVTGWTDVTAGPTLVSGETTPPGDNTISPAPNAAGVGYNSTGWFRTKTTQAAGVGVFMYDGTDGGGGADPTDYTIEANVFVSVHATHRHQQGVFVRWASGQGFLPFQLFHAVNVDGQPNGYGWRGANSTTTYNAFDDVVETGNRWVRMKIQVQGTDATLSIDRDLDGTYELSKTTTLTASVAGKPGVFYVINDPTSGYVPVAGTYGYFDNFTYVNPAAIEDWTLYN